MGWLSSSALLIVALGSGSPKFYASQSSLNAALFGMVAVLAVGLAACGVALKNSTSAGIARASTRTTSLKQPDAQVAAHENSSHEVCN